MYQTGGLFHPLLSQRIYQSNQGLKLSAKAFQPPKGVFICLKSCRLSNDSEADIKQKSCFLSARASAVKGPTGQPPLPAPSSGPRPSLAPLAFIWLRLSCPSFQNDTRFISGLHLTDSTEHQSLSCLSQSSDFTQDSAPREAQAGTDRQCDDGSQGRCCCYFPLTASHVQLNGHFCCQVLLLLYKTRAGHS